MMAAEMARALSRTAARDGGGHAAARYTMTARRRCRYGMAITGSSFTAGPAAIRATSSPSCTDLG